MVRRRLYRGWQPKLLCRRVFVRQAIPRLTAYDDIWNEVLFVSRGRACLAIETTNTPIGLSKDCVFRCWLDVWSSDSDIAGRGWQDKGKGDCNAEKILEVIGLNNEMLAHAGMADEG